jgi:hypothetical protein
LALGGDSREVAREGGVVLIAGSLISLLRATGQPNQPGRIWRLGIKTVQLD